MYSTPPSVPQAPWSSHEYLVWQTRHAVWPSIQKKIENIFSSLVRTNKQYIWAILDECLYAASCAKHSLERGAH